MISIVVPVLNEAPRLPAMLDMLDAQPGEKQIILADGGSADDTRVVAEGRALIVESQPGRARQMNAGAAHAEGETILFLHCDTRLPPGALRDIEDFMRAGDVGRRGLSPRLRSRRSFQPLHQLQRQHAHQDGETLLRRSSAYSSSSARSVRAHGRLRRYAPVRGLGPEQEDARVRAHRHHRDARPYGERP